MNLYAATCFFFIALLGAFGLGYAIKTQPLTQENPYQENRPSHSNESSEPREQKADNQTDQRTAVSKNDSKNEGVISNFLLRYEKEATVVSAISTGLFTVILAIATIWLAIATKGLWDYAAEQARDMKSTIQAARDSAQAAEDAVGLERAWIGTPDIKTEEPIPGEHIFRYYIKSTGKANVRGFFVGARLVLEVNKLNEDELIESCEANYTADNDRYSLVPGDEFSIADNVGNKEISTRLNVAKWRDAHGDKSPIILGCILYGPRSEGKLHRTVFIVQLELDGDKVKVIQKWSALAN